MTDRIDIDDLDVSEPDEETPNRGDWFWAGEGDPDEETDWLSADDDGDGGGGRATDGDGDGGGGRATDGDADQAGADAADEDADHAAPATPRVPRTDDEAPVGIPVHSGGAGAGDAGGDETSAGDPANGRESEARGEGTAGHAPAAGGTAHESHADPDEMTTAFTYDAIRRLSNPHRALTEARGWSDWVGVVGDVEAHVLNKFQREHRLDLDFFNGTGTGPAERLASVDERSMFYANRMVVVGVDGESWIAEAADWEFVPLAEAADGADWELDET